MNIEQMNDFIAERINLIKDNKIKEKLPNQNGLLIHIIPEKLIEENLIDWSKERHQNILKNDAFKRLSGINTNYEDLGNRILGYSPDKKYFICFQNGIVETYKIPLKRSKISNQNHEFINVDNIFFQVLKTMEAAKITHQKILKPMPTYYIFITFLGIKNTYLYSFDNKYISAKPFPDKHTTFEPFIWEDFATDIIPDIKNVVHTGIKSYKLKIKKIK